MEARNTYEISVTLSRWNCGDSKMKIKPSPMNKRVKKQWLKALRSRKYKQGRGRLLDKKGKMCCLGVLTDLYIRSKEGKESNARWDDEGHFRSRQCQAEELNLPGVVADWAGLGTTAPVLRQREIVAHARIVGHFDTNNCAQAINDDERLSFGQIARLIERNL
jgi:hypothetical protein